MSNATEINVTSTTFAGLILAFVLGVAVTCGVGYYAGAFKESPELARLRAHNDSVTVRVASLVRSSDSLTALAKTQATTADSAKAVSENLTATLRALTRKRVDIPKMISQLPDTGVARRFNELLK